MSAAPYLLVGLSILGTTPGRAQGSVETSLGQVRAGQLVKVRTQDGRLVEGRFSTFSLSPPHLQLEDPDSSFHTGSIDSLWVRGTRAKTGAIVGGVVLGVASGVVLGAFCEYGGEYDGCDQWGMVAALTLAGAATGAGLGALIGSAFPHWRLRYARSGAGLGLHRSPDRVGFSVTVPVSIH